ncbi:hypothetical protein AVEN_268769-1 [Araneus ventricosus]|uniref:Uncharacterized protein n=1 Tax=Araneus ventricosus TaxID=182803 RepID=A0A4Y2K9Q1_ARAVE|nr:hypothetical protein AVEN_268769-1 [Araneus ventricosus]
MPDRQEHAAKVMECVRYFYALFHFLRSVMSLAALNWLNHEYARRQEYAVKVMGCSWFWRFVSFPVGRCTLAAPELSEPLFAPDGRACR